MNKIVLISVCVLVLAGMIGFDFFISRFLDKPSNKNESENDSKDKGE